MDDMRSPRRPTLRAIGGFVLAIFVLALAVAACGTSASPAPSAAPTGSLVPPLTGQTDTEWGTIWDAIPPDFPVYAGATPSQETATAPASANLVVAGGDAKTIATWTADQLSSAGYDVNGGSVALEDGSYAVDGEREPGCQVHVEVAPLGTVTSITILYGASCPNT
jgi:hypothetical protein